MHDQRAPGAEPGARTMSGPGTPRAFDVAYEGTPTWDTGRVQPAVVRLLEAGLLAGSILDVGCGTGLHAVLLAERGSRVAGVDIAAAALEKARARASAAGVASAFLAGDALGLAALGPALGAPFDVALDVGLFHVLQPADGTRYARALASVVRPGGRAYIVCWSDRNPFGYGPERVSRRVLRGTFRRAEGWTIERIEPDVLETLLPDGRVHAWVAHLRRR